MVFRKATWDDIDAIAALFEKVHDGEEAGKTTCHWVRGVYPTRQTAEAALERDDLFVCVLSFTDDDELNEPTAVSDGIIAASAVINQIQVEDYYSAPWENEASDDEVMVIHALAVSPDMQGKGIGKAFVAFYEEYALENNAPFLRMDTHGENTIARGLYGSLGYREAAIVPTEFNGLKDVPLVLLEKKL